MLKINSSVQNLDKLEQQIKRVDKLLELQKDQSLLCEKLATQMLKILNQVAKQRINLIPTSNDDLKGSYLNNNKYRIEGNTIILYNDLCVVSPASKISDEYTFCVALAFEYGTGVIGKENPKIGAWSYDVNSGRNRAFINGEQLDGWWLPKEKAGGVKILAESKNGNAVVVQGYEGMEIYRFAREEIVKQLPKIINDLLNEKEV